MYVYAFVPCVHFGIYGFVQRSRAEIHFKMRFVSACRGVSGRLFNKACLFMGMI